MFWAIPKAATQEITCKMLQIPAIGQCTVFSQGMPATELLSCNARWNYSHVYIRENFLVLISI
jgi:hypothetical protein